MSASDQRSTTVTAEPPLARAMKPINYLVERFIPSALIFAIVLTVVVAIMALVLTDSGPVAVIEGWGAGLSGLLEFMTQMALILLLGHALVSTRPIRALLGKLASVPRSPLRAYLLLRFRSRGCLLPDHVGLRAGRGWPTWWSISPGAGP